MIMKNTGTFRTAIALLVACAFLASIAGMAGAVNGMRTSLPAGAQPLAAGGPAAGGQAMTPVNPITMGGPQIGGGAGASGNVGNPYVTGGPSRCVGNLCTADWVSTGGTPIGGGTRVTPQGTPGTGPGTGLNVPAGAGAQGRDYSEWYARCAGVVGPGNDPMCRLGSPQSPYATGGQQFGVGTGAAGNQGTLPGTGGPTIGGQTTTLTNPVAFGGPQIGGGPRTV